MKYALCAIVVVLIAGIPQSTLSQPRSSTTLAKDSAISSKAGRSVYVDKAELAVLHPSWQALSDMRAVLARAGKTSGTRRSAPTRTELAAKSMIKAHQALAELEAGKLEALRLRGEAMKAHKLQAAESDWKADARNIEEAAAQQTAAVDRQDSDELLNVRLKAIAAEAITKVAEKDKSGVDQTAAGESLKSAKGREASVENANEAEKDRIMALAADKIKALKDASDKRVDAEVDGYEIEQTKRVGDEIASAKDDIARQMGSDAVAVADSLIAESEAASVGSSLRLHGDLNDLRSAVATLQARIAKDVDVAVQDVAKQRGVNVTYQRRPAVPDATKTFVETIRKRGWNASGSVMAGSGSS